MVDRVAMAREAIDRAAALTVNWKGPCHECKSFKQHYGSFISDEDKCLNSVVRMEIFTPHGGFDLNLPTCRNARMDDGLCGPDGELFEPLNPPVDETQRKKSFLEKIFG